VSQFFVYENPNRDTKKAYPLLLDIQSNLIEELTSTIVIPLALKRSIGRVIAKLTPVLQIDGVDYVLLTQQISGLDRGGLGRQVADLSIYRYEIITAIDFVISGV
jgi:toxin CcdB